MSAAAQSMPVLLSVSVNIQAGAGQLRPCLKARPRLRPRPLPHSILVCKARGNAWAGSLGSPTRYSGPPKSIRGIRNSIIVRDNGLTMGM